MKKRQAGIFWIFCLLLCITLPMIISPQSVHAASAVDPEAVLDKKIKSYSIKGTFAQAVKQIEKKVESNSQVNLFFSLGSYYYLTCRSTVALASDDNLKSLMQLEKQFETAVVNHNKKFVL